MTDLTQLQRDSRIRTTALVVLTFIAVAVALYFLRPVLMPFVLALFIASGLVPVLNAVQRGLDSSRPRAIFVTFLLSITLTVALWAIIAVSIKQLSSAEKPYTAGFKLMLARIGKIAEPLLPDVPEGDARARLVKEQAEERTESLAEEQKAYARPEQSADEADVAPAEGADQPDATEDPTVQPPPADAVRATVEAAAAEASRLTEFLSSRMSSVLLLGVNELLAVLSSGLLVMIFLFFLLLGGSDVQLPENNIWREVDIYVRRYIVAKTLISAATGLVFGLVLWLFGVPLALVLGMLAFLLNFIPNLGPIIASLLPVPLVWVLVEATWAYKELPADTQRELTDPDMGLVKAVMAIVLAALVQFFSGNVVEPKIMGDQFRLHPIAILLSLMFWYMIWGMVGAFLAVPITSALKIVLGELESTKPVADVLEGNLSILAKRETPPTTATA